MVQSSFCMDIIYNNLIFIKHPLREMIFIPGDLDSHSVVIITYFSINSWGKHVTLYESAGNTDVRENNKIFKGLLFNISWLTYWLWLGRGGNILFWSWFLFRIYSKIDLEISLQL